MAERRMFAGTIVESDAFMDMPFSAQALYVHLSMNADDDGFVNNPKQIRRMIGADDKDLQLLIEKRFILRFESDVIVIKHWKINNYIRNDRYKPTVYQKELAQLEEKSNKAYTEKKVGIPSDYQVGDSWYTQYRVGKCNLGEGSVGEGNTTDPTDTHPSQKLELIGGIVGQNVLLLSEAQMCDLMDRIGIDGWKEYGTRLSNYIRKGNVVKNHYKTILKWWEEDNAT